MTLLPVLDSGFRTPSRGDQATATQPAECSDRAEKPELVRTIDLVDLATEIERHGIGSIKPMILQELARRGLARGLHPEVAAIISESNTPAVARERAFGLLHRLLAVHEAAAPR